MKKLKFILLLILCNILIPLNAQISGNVVNSEKNVVEFANISLIKNDTVFMYGSSSGINGYFILEMPKEKGSYQLSITCLGFENKRVRIDNQENELELGYIVLDSVSQQLSEVIITANRIQRNPGGYLVNLKGEEITKGKQANELLQFLPGITSEDGTLKVLGQNIAVIYLNDVRIKDQKELEAIPAELLQSAQIDYMAGSREVASVKGAVIHLKLNKQPEGGYFGSIAGGATTMTKYGFTGDHLSSAFNYRYKKWSIYNNLSYNDRKATGDFEEQREFKTTGTTINSTEEFRSWSRNFYNRLSLTYDLSADKTLGASFYISTNKANPVNNIVSTTLSNGIAKNQQSSVETPYSYNRYQITSKYNWSVDDKGSEFVITTDYLRNNEKDEVKSSVFTNSTPDITRGHSQQNTNMIEADTYFKKAFSSDRLLITGLNYRFIHTDYNLTDDPHISEKAQSFGHMPAFYSEYTGSKNRLQYQLGLRVQQNKIGYKVLDRSVNNSKSEWSIFPSVDLLYILNEKKGHMFILSYKRSIDDIPYSAISPYKRYSSEYFYTTGNPDLISPKQNMAMAVLELFNMFTINGLYMYGRAPIYFATEIDNNNPLLSYTIPRNGKNEIMLGVGIEGRFDILKSWKLKAVGRYLSYSAETPSYKVKNQSKYYYSINNNFIFTKNSGATLEGYYEPTFRFTDRVYHTVYEVRGSLYKKFFDDKLEGKLNFKLFRRGRVLETDTPEFWSKSTNKTNEQYFQLMLTYFFRGGRKVTVKRTTSIQDYNKIEDTK